MKKKLIVAAVAALVSASAFSQATLSPQVVTTTNFNPVMFTGADAQAIAKQLLSVTNSAGQLVVPAPALTNKASFTVNIHVTNSNGVPVTINAAIH